MTTTYMPSKLTCPACGHQALRRVSSNDELSHVCPLQPEHHVIVPKPRDGG